MDVKDIMIAKTIRLDARGPRGVAVSSRRCALLPSSQLAGGHIPCMTNTNTNTKQPTKLPTGRWAQKTKEVTQKNQQSNSQFKGSHKSKQPPKEAT